MTEAVEMEPCAIIAASPQKPGTGSGTENPGESGADVPDFEGPTI